MVRCYEIIDGVEDDEVEIQDSSAAGGNSRVAYTWPRPFFMVFECLQYDLDGILYCNRDHFTPAHVQCYIRQILDGLAVIHGMGVIHRDLKPSNILMNSQGVIKIADGVWPCWCRNGSSQSRPAAAIVPLQRRRQ